MMYVRIFILLVVLSSLCQSDDQLTHTKPLSPKDTLISAGGDFALGFFSPTSSSNKLYIGIWYNNVPERERTVVWIANRDSPVTTPATSVKLAVTNDSELVLSDSQGHIFWMATSSTSGGAGAFAVLLNSGNFVVRSPNGMDVWQSFDHPTDTVLPTMRSMIRYRSQPATGLFAWKSPDDPSTGDISSGMDPASSNVQVFIWNGTLPYYRSSFFNDVPASGGTYQANNTSVTYQWMMVDTGDEIYYTFTVLAGSPYMHFSLHHTGKMRLLVWENSTSSWVLISEEPSVGCDLYASCGPFGYCDLTKAMPTCQCPDHFELVDSLNFSRGCQRKEELKCGTESYFMTMPNMKIPDKFLHIRNRTFDQCAAECARNCTCMAYAYATLSTASTTGDASRCLVWTQDLIDMEKASVFLENLYIRLGESPGTLVSFS